MASGMGMGCRASCLASAITYQLQSQRSWSRHGRASGEDLDTCCHLLLVMALLKLPSLEIHRFCREVWRSSVLLKLSRTYTYEQKPFEACLVSKFGGLQ